MKQIVAGFYKDFKGIKDNKKPVVSPKLNLDGAVEIKFRGWSQWEKCH